MDYDEKKKRQLIRVLITEAFMVIAVIAIVAVATLAAMGFFISSDGQIAQAGLMHIYSQPTGATVELDGVTLFSKTNLSRSMSEGVHSIKISRGGYDTWSKSLRMRSGTLFRLYYPRLFLQDRTSETILTLGGGAGLSDESELEFYSASPNHNLVIYAMNDSTEWRLIDLKSDDVRETVLELSGVLPGVTELSKTAKKGQLTSVAPDYRFDGVIEQLVWSANDEKILAKIIANNETNWILINLKDVQKTVNLTTTFGLDCDQIAMIDSSANQLYALSDQQLRKINVSDASVSRILLSDVVSFANYGAELVYYDGRTQTIRTYRDGDTESAEISVLPEDTERVLVAIAKYYDDYYIAYVVNDKLETWSGNWNDLKPYVSDYTFGVTPTKLVAAPSNGYFVASAGKTLMVLDFELDAVNEYEAVQNDVGWLVSGMMYAVKDGEIIVWDFDGANLRNLADSQTEKVAVMNEEVVIPTNNRWIYYLTRGKKGEIILSREKIRD